VIAPLGKRWDRGDLIPLPIAACQLSVGKTKTTSNQKQTNSK